MLRNVVCDYQKRSRMEWMYSPLCRTAKLAAMSAGARAIADKTVKTVALPDSVAAVEVRDEPGNLACPRLGNMVKDGSFRHHATSRIWCNIQHQVVLSPQME